MDKGYVPVLTILAIIGVLILLGVVIYWQTQIIYKPSNAPATPTSEVIRPSTAENQ